MGLLDFFKRRSERERAIPGAEAGDSGTFSIGAPSQQADPAKGGSPGALTQPSQTIDASNVAGLRDNVLAILERRGIDPMSSQTRAIDASDFPGLAEEIQAALAGTGIQLPAVNWSPKGVPGLMQMSQPPAGLDTDHRLKQLTQLRDSGLITPAEFEHQRSRILGEL
jgi:hypothetical protein